VRDLVREVLLLDERLVRAPALAGFRAVVLRLVVVERLGAPGVLVAITRSYSRLALSQKPIEHVFVHDRLARVTHPHMTFL
jgi:hypothetical protein